MFLLANMNQLQLVIQVKHKFTEQIKQSIQVYSIFSKQSLCVASLSSKIFSQKVANIKTLFSPKEVHEAKIFKDFSHFKERFHKIQVDNAIYMKSI
jgi:hypothetical protein